MSRAPTADARTHTITIAVLHRWSRRTCKPTVHVGDVLSDLDRLFPGICFRVVDEQGRLRPHMRVFINDEMVRDLSTVLNPDDEVTLMQALSGG